MTKQPPKNMRSSARRAPQHGSAFVVMSWLFVVIMLCVIFFMSAQTGDKLNNDSGILSAIIDALDSLAAMIFGHDVDVSPVGHFTEFFLLGLALVNALRLNVPIRTSGVLAVVIASLYGVSDEIHQIFVPSRTCDPLDWLVDTIAALLAVLIFTLIYRSRSRQGKDSL